MLGGKTRFQLYKSSGLVGWLPKGKRKILDILIRWRFPSIVELNELSELDVKLPAIVLRAFASKGPYTHYIMLQLKAWWANTKIQIASCVLYQAACFPMGEIDDCFFPDLIIWRHHLRAFDLNVLHGTRVTFVNWRWPCIRMRVEMILKTISTSTWLEGTHWIWKWPMIVCSSAATSGGKTNISLIRKNSISASRNFVTY